MWPYVDVVGEVRETQEIDPLPPLRYPDDCDIPIFAREGEDEIRDMLLRIRCFPRSFGVVSNGTPPSAGLVGVRFPGVSTMSSSMICAIVTN